MKTLLKLSCAVYMLLAANVMYAQKNVRQKGMSEEELGKQAIALYNQGKCDESIEVLKKVLVINPSNASVCNIIGSLYKEKFENDLKVINERHYTVEADRQADIKKTVNSNGKEAVRYFEKVTELNPDDEDARNTLQAVREYLNEKSQNL